MRSNTNLESRRIRFIVQWMPPFLGFLVSFFAISNYIGYQNALEIAIIATLVLWIISNQIVHRDSRGVASLERNSPAYGCAYCGEMRIILPPDSDFVYIRSEPCSHGDSKMISWTCRECRKINVRYWDRYHPQVSTGVVR